MNYHEALNNKVIVITGASGGVGRAAARAFARYNTKIALLARGAEGLESARGEVEASGSEALVILTDVADPVQVERAAKLVEDKWGKIDVWVNNAMLSVFSPFMEMTPEEFKRVTETTYLGAAYGTMAALKRMKPRNEGTIILVGSALAFRGIPLQSAYCGAKHAVKGFFESVSSELLHERSGVHICMVHLPALNTPHFDWVKSKLDRKPKPVGKIYQPEVAAEAIVFIAAHRRRSLVVGSTTAMTIAGSRLFPKLGDIISARYGYEGQLSPEPETPGKPDNLWEPVNEDRGAHGRFDDQAVNTSIQYRISINRKKLLWAASVVLLGAAIVKLMR